ncbi:MAG: manganese efflux pump MntP family protein [Victivallaceae bacterium]
MSLFEIMLLAVGVAIDAFAVSVSCGLAEKKLKYRYALMAGAFFGGFQIFMPLVGWLFGFLFRDLILNYDHWVAFILLVFVGGKMLYEAFKNEDDSDSEIIPISPFTLNNMCLLALATSIDALAVGASLAMVETDIMLPALAMGIVTFLLSVAGVIIGTVFGHLFERKIEIVGGVVIVFIGFKILIEHLVTER